MIGVAIWAFMLGLSLGFIVCNHLNRKMRQEVDLLLEAIRKDISGPSDDAALRASTRRKETR